MCLDPETAPDGVEVIEPARPGRRRRFTAEEKRTIVQETVVPPRQLIAQFESNGVQLAGSVKRPVPASGDSAAFNVAAVSEAQLGRDATIWFEATCRSSVQVSSWPTVAVQLDGTCETVLESHGEPVVSPASPLRHWL